MKIICVVQMSLNVWPSAWEWLTYQGLSSQRRWTFLHPGWKEYSALNSFFIILIFFTNSIGLYKVIKTRKECFLLVFLLLLVYLFTYLVSFYNPTKVSAPSSPPSSFPNLTSPHLLLHGYQSAVLYQVAGRIGTSSSFEGGWGNLVGGTGTQSR